MPRAAGANSWLPHPGAWVALAAAVGLAIVALGEDLSRAALLPTPFLIWAGVALIIGPITYRVTDPRAGTAERLALVAVAGVAFFLVKVVRSPFTFTVVDELFHLTNLNNILATHHLYSPNPGLSVSADYPGLEGTASAIAMLAGISPFAAGTILVGIIRVTALCAQFALFSAVSRSSAVGALGAVFSLANPNTLFFEGAFAYESLALPLFLVLLAALASRQRTGQRSEARGWLVVAVTVMLAVVPTHHLTSYVMMLVLAVMSLRGIRLPGRVPTLKLGKARPVWPLAVLAFVVIGAWLMFVASQTVGYLSPAIQAALVSTLKTLTGATQAHAPFSGQHPYGGANASNTPGEIIIALLEPVLLVSAAALGWRKAWRGPDSEKMLVVFVLGALAFCAATAARVFPNVWQIADRGAEYLFVGVAYLIGSLRLGYHRVIWGRRAGRAGVALVAAMCVIGGVITAWPAASRNAQPTQITVGGRTIYSERLALARWSASLPPGLFAAIEADSLYLQADGKRQMINGLGSGYLVGNEAVLAGTDWTARDAASFRRQHVRYVVLDRSPAARDWVQGMYLQLAPPTGLAFHLGPRSVLTKLDAHAARVYDSGDIAVYDLAGRP